MTEYWKNISLENIFYLNENRELLQEEWRPVVNYENIYQVSNLGRIKILSRFIERKSLNGFICKEKIKKPRLNKNGYIIIDLTNSNKITTTKRVSVVVAESFLNHNSCGFNLVVDHIKNNEKTNNSIYNLQIITQRENASKDKKNKNTGVYFKKNTLHRKHPYEVKITIGKKKISIGCFESIEKANEYYKLAILNLSNFDGNAKNFRNLLNRPDKGSKLDESKVKLIRRYFLIYPHMDKQKLSEKLNITSIFLRSILSNRAWYDENYSTETYKKYKYKNNSKISN